MPSGRDVCSVCRARDSDLQAGRCMSGKKCNGYYNAVRRFCVDKLFEIQLLGQTVRVGWVRYRLFDGSLPASHAGCR